MGSPPFVWTSKISGLSEPGLTYHHCIKYCRLLQFTNKKVTIIYSFKSMLEAYMSRSSMYIFNMLYFYKIFAVEQNNEQDTDYTKAGNSLPPSQVVIGNGKVPVTQISCGQYHSGKYTLKTPVILW